jgi:hypothetical protein
MSKQRAILLSLGLAAMMGLLASEAKAETITLTVYAGAGTGGPVIFTTTGGINSVSANIAALNADLGTSGFSAYSFGTLGGSSNLGQTGATTGQLGMAGNLTVNTSGSNTGANTPITIVVTESGFTIPASAVAMGEVGQAGFLGSASDSSVTHSGIYSDSSTPTPITTTDTVGPLAPTSPLLSPQSGTDLRFIPGGTILPYTLTSMTVVSESPVLTQAQVGLTNALTVGGASVPEPAGLAMMLTGLPLPLVLLGLLRRRRAAA